MERIWSDVFSDASQWPMVHVFVPAVITIYHRNIWILLSIIYLFETVEYLMSQIPGLSYWGENSKADSLVSDIIMGLVGFATIIILKIQKPQAKNILSPARYKSKYYLFIAPYLHVGLASGASSISSTLEVSGLLPENSPITLIVFGTLYVLVAILFGWIEWAAISACNMLIITVITSFVGHTAVVSLATVTLSTIAIFNYKDIILRRLGQDQQVSEDVHIYNSKQISNNEKGNRLYF